MREQVIREYVRLPNARGALSAELCYPLARTTFACLIANPHPHMGGRMSNNVVTHLAASLAAGGAVTLRFDYAGVGNSDGPPVDVAASMAAFWKTGRAPEDPLMIEDAQAALDWLRRNRPLPLVLTGYSFGAYAVTQLTYEEPDAFILISPTIAQHDFGAFTRCAVPKLVIGGEGDFATPDGTFESWAAALTEPKTVRRVVGGNHFFRDRERDIADACLAFIRRVLADGVDLACP